MREGDSVPDLRTPGARVAWALASFGHHFLPVVLAALATVGVIYGVAREGRIWGWW